MAPSATARTRARRTKRGPKRAQPAMKRVRDHACAAVRSAMRSGPAAIARARTSPATMTVTVPALITAPNTIDPTAATSADTATPASAAGTVASAASADAAPSSPGPVAGRAFGTDCRSSSSAAPASGMPASAFTTDSAIACAITTGQLAVAITLPRSSRDLSRGASIGRSTIPSPAIRRRPRHGILQESARACRRTARPRADARDPVRGPDRDRRSPARRARRPSRRRRHPRRAGHRRPRPRLRRVAARRRRRHPRRPRVRHAASRRALDRRPAAPRRNGGAPAGRSRRAGRRARVAAAVVRRDRHHPRSRRRRAGPDDLRRHRPSAGLGRPAVGAAVPASAGPRQPVRRQCGARPPPRRSGADRRVGDQRPTPRHGRRRSAPVGALREPTGRDLRRRDRLRAGHAAALLRRSRPGRQRLRHRRSRMARRCSKRPSPPMPRPRPGRAGNRASIAWR